MVTSFTFSLKCVPTVLAIAYCRFLSGQAKAKAEKSTLGRSRSNRHLQGQGSRVALLGSGGSGGSGTSQTVGAASVDSTATSVVADRVLLTEAVYNPALNKVLRHEILEYTYVAPIKFSEPPGSARKSRSRFQMVSYGLFAFVGVNAIMCFCFPIAITYPALNY